MQSTDSEHGFHSTLIVQNFSLDPIWSHLNLSIRSELEEKILPTAHNAFLEHALGAPPDQVYK